MFKALIRKFGLRCTPARVAVLEILSKMGKPMSHAEVGDALESKNFDRATIFRNLTDLAEVGLLSRIDLGDHVWRFEVKSAHPHFVCTDCGDISCLSDTDIQVSTKRVAVSEVLLKGHCEDCK